MYEPENTRFFYDVYSEKEWERLEKTAYGRLQAIIHHDFLKKYINPNDRVHDAGSGPGRFSISLFEIGARITVLDISDEQLKLAREKLAEKKLLDKVEGFTRADIVDLSIFPDRYFDAVICFGGALSYVCDERHKAASELMRVTKENGIILVSVMSRLGGTISFIIQPELPAFQEPDMYGRDYSLLWEVLETGNLPAFSSTKVNIQHPQMHLCTSEELKELFNKCKIIEIAGSNVITTEYSSLLENIPADLEAWEAVVKLERLLNSRPGLIDAGSHIILVARK
jgi:ubiquinone/menaquinone biosynthesis C-methylase UbiE